MISTVIDMNWCDLAYIPILGNLKTVIHSKSKLLHILSDELQSSCLVLLKFPLEKILSHFYYIIGACDTTLNTAFELFHVCNQIIHGLY